MRTVIIGNSGSGKTWLTIRLAEKSASSAVHLDEIFWLPDGFNERRESSEVTRLINVAKSKGDWIVEGVYGNLAEQFLPSACVLIWLELPWAVCRQRLESRGSESKAHMGREQSAAGLRELLDWAESYPTRQGSSGYSAHLALFQSFRGQRHRLKSDSQVQEYLSAV